MRKTLSSLTILLIGAVVPSVVRATEPAWFRTYGDLERSGTPRVLAVGERFAVVEPIVDGTVVQWTLADGAVESAVKFPINGGTSIALVKDSRIALAGWFGRLSESQKSWSKRDESASWLAIVDGKDVVLAILYREDEQGDVRINDLLRLPDGGFIAVGRIGLHASLAMRLDSAGAPIWAKVWDFSGQDELRRVVAHGDDFVAAGVANGKPLLMSFADNGRIKWKHSFACCDGEAWSVARNAAGELTLAGSSFETDADILLIRVDSAGRPMWGRSIGTRYPDNAFDIRIAESGHSLVAGTCRSKPIGNYRLWLLEVDPDGRLGWYFVMLVEDAPLAGFPWHASADITSSGRWVFAGSPGAEPRRLTIGSVPIDPLSPELASSLPIRARDVELGAFDPVLESRSASLSVSKLALTAGSPAKVHGKTIAPTPLRSSAPALVEATTPSMSGGNNPASIAEVEALVGTLFRERRFDELDKLGATLRSEKAMFPSGEAKLYFFYEGLGPGSNALKGLGRAELLALFDEWRKSSPRSLTARIAHAAALASFGWRERGDSYSNEVTAEGWKGFQKYSDLAYEALSGYRGAITDPHYHLLLLEFAARNGEDIWPHFVNGTNLDPHYYYLYNYATINSLEKWGGSVERIRAVENRGLELTRDRIGTGIIARISWVLALNALADYNSLARDWVTVQEAFDDWMKAYPESTRAMHRLGRMACRLKDRRVARSVFRRDDITWETGKETEWSTESFESCREWALRDPAAHWVDGSTLSSPQPSTMRRPARFEIASDDKSVERAIDYLQLWLRPTAEEPWPTMLRTATVTPSRGNALPAYVSFVSPANNAPPLALTSVFLRLDLTDACWVADSGDEIRGARYLPGLQFIVLDTTMSPVEILVPSSRSVVPGDKLYVVFLDEAGKQQVAVAYARSRNQGTKDQPREGFDAVLAAGVKYPKLDGAAILNEDGELAGIVIRSFKSQEGIDFVYSESVSGVSRHAEGQ